MKRCIIYGRNSTNKQTAESIETQIYECQQWAIKNNCQVVEIYDDSGQSGRSYNVKNRKGFNQILEDAKKGKMDYALIHKIDRFARSVHDYLVQEQQLEKYGVKVIVVGMPFMQEYDNIVFKSLHIALAEQFSINLSSEVKTKMRTFARKKSFLGGKAPYGYKVIKNGNEKTLAINEEQASGVRLIYQLYLQGYGYIKISQLIAEKGYLNEKNEPFTPYHISKILRSKKYNGWYVFGKKEIHNGKERPVQDKSQIIEVPNAHEKIIDDITFQAVQNKLNANIPKNKRKARFYPLTGLIRCASCGRSMTGQSTVNRNRKTNKYVYYKCNGYKVNGCKTPSIRADYLEEFIMQKVKDYVFNDEFTSNLIAEIDRNLSTDLTQFNQIKLQVEKDLERVNSQIKKALKDKYQELISSELFAEVVEELNAEKELLEIRLININQQINVENKKDDILQFVNDIKSSIISDDKEVQHAILQQVVNQIIVDGDDIQVHLNIVPTPIGTSIADDLSNINGGVPLFMIDKHIQVYSGNGFDFLKFTIHNIKRFNQKLKL